MAGETCGRIEEIVTIVAPGDLGDEEEEVREEMMWGRE
jgi:hypothetical protein